MFNGHIKAVRRRRGAGILDVYRIGRRADEGFSRRDIGRFRGDRTPNATGVEPE